MYILPNTFLNEIANKLLEVYIQADFIYFYQVLVNILIFDKAFYTMTLLLPKRV